MATTFKDMIGMTAAYMQRDPSTFSYSYSSSTYDLLKLSINGARRWAELERDFEMCRAQTQLSIPLATGADISGMTALDGVTPVPVKKLIKAFLPIPGSTGTAGQFPIDVMTRDAHVQRVQRSYDTTTSINNAKNRHPTLVPYFAVVRMADTIYLTPPDTTTFGGVDPVLVQFDVTRFLPDYVNLTDTDFFMTYCTQWLIMQTCHQLNFFLKDDQRIPVNKDVLAQHWHAVIAWDSNLVASSSSDADLG
jgi:hypothetical protein